MRNLERDSEMWPGVTWGQKVGSQCGTPTRSDSHTRQIQCQAQSPASLNAISWSTQPDMSLQRVGWPLAAKGRTDHRNETTATVLDEGSCVLKPIYIGCVHEATAS